MSTVEIPREADPAAKTWTAEELLRHPEGKSYELVDGELVRRAMGARSSSFAVRLTVRLGAFVLDNDLGELFDSEMGYRCFGGIESQRVRKPDLSFVRSDRVPREGLPDGWLTIRPDLAVEILSPHDTIRDVNAKLADYRLVEIPLVWIVDPDQRSVTVYRDANELPAAILHEPDTLTGGDVLPGFEVTVADIFPPRPVGGTDR